MTFTDPSAFIIAQGEQKRVGVPAYRIGVWETSRACRRSASFAGLSVSSRNKTLLNPSPKGNLGSSVTLRASRRNQSGPVRPERIEIAAKSGSVL
jgi:hypothetical protein